ncbi:hypothetical protein I3843_11G053200 [Carya illinoinensis]|nr:hypothetical protein I3843_11G053200 [Carya illinoinensis]KAG7955085.1 hypothetical protein I3843_11G053200 [Carya illinoinensis]
MAMQDASPTLSPSAQVVGNAFVEQYYHILHQSPNLVHRFYQDTSLLSRPDANGNMATVTSMQAINEKILDFNYDDYTAEIKTADAQDSYEKGVIVLVTGCLTGKDNLRRKFTQTFFLAPQDKGYFVLNDVFRYIEENDLLQTNSVAVHSINENVPIAALTPEPEPAHAPEVPAVEPASSFEEEDIIEVAEVCDPSDNEEGSVVEDEVIQPPAHPTQNEILKEVDSTVVDSAPAAEEDVPKKSYASIVKVMKGTVPNSAHASIRKLRVEPTYPDQQSHSSAKPAPAPEASAPNSDSAPESSDVPEEAEGHSIYVRNLPHNATDTQLEEEFKKFGPIKHGGIQVRSNKQGFTFGFVEFETISSMHSALEASPITIGDRRAVVEEKRTTTRVASSGRGRYSSGRGGFRSESFKIRGNFGGARGYSRNEFRNQGEFSGRPRGSIGRNGEGHQRANQNGSGRGGRQGGVNRNAAA